MGKFTKEIEDKIRDLGRMLKLQFDFAAAADMSKQEDFLEFAAKNAKTAALMIDVIQSLDMKITDNAAVLEEIAAIAEQNGSNAGDLLKQLAPKVRAINAEAQSLYFQRAAENKQVSPEDMNGIFRKHLKP